MTWTDQAGGLVEDGQWVEKNGLVKDIHDANADIEKSAENADGRYIDSGFISDTSVTNPLNHASTQLECAYRAHTQEPAMTQIQEPTPETQPAPRPRRTWMLVAGAAAVAVVAVIGTVIVMKTGTTPNAPADAPTAAATFTLRGSITMANTGGVIQADENGGCRGIGGYSDISSGTAVTVQDDHGQTVAMGSIGVSAAVETTMNMPALNLPPTPFVTSCTMYFTVDGVPEGHSVYSVTVSHRGSQVFTSDQAHSAVELSLNSR